ncbi:hypothetical protein DAPPUDRAFT_307707 [Daphnia pulex]|uniref:Uncharacterized protein n=1 Tax=Daphnia pulex TaxID=6669 RepID=E9H4F5_DAPPU|nr:hypothetical protein DAPPUDRAFT_307707 [Daphnia pulex]|eukprot:EFX73374.1 hypothetical protein DAPPUDRAFT_307707 [Daphnia pulex]
MLYLTELLLSNVFSKEFIQTKYIILCIRSTCNNRIFYFFLLFSLINWPSLDVLAICFSNVYVCVFVGYVMLNMSSEDT